MARGVIAGAGAPLDAGAGSWLEGAQPNECGTMCSSARMKSAQLSKCDSTMDTFYCTSTRIDGGLIAKHLENQVLTCKFRCRSWRTCSRCARAAIPRAAAGSPRTPPVSVTRNVRVMNWWHKNRGVCHLPMNCRGSTSADRVCSV